MHERIKQDKGMNAEVKKKTVGSKYGPGAYLLTRDNLGH
jgi:hypothetical protein